MLLFQVSLTGQDSKQISHKYFNCSAERHLQSPAPLCALYVLYPAVGAFHVSLVPSSGVCVELQDLFCYFLFFSVEVTALGFFFLLLSTVTMVLFLIGISIPVNNSSHENQTAGN